MAEPTNRLLEYMTQGDRVRSGQPLFSVGPAAALGYYGAQPPETDRPDNMLLRYMQQGY